MSNSKNKCVRVLSGGVVRLEKKRIKIHQMIWKWRISFHEKNTHFFILYYNSLQQRAVHRCLFIHSFFLFSFLLLSLSLFPSYTLYIYSYACFLSVNCYYIRSNTPFWRILQFQSEIWQVIRKLYWQRLDLRKRPCI